MDKSRMAGLLAGVALLGLWVALQAKALWLAAILLVAFYIWYAQMRER